MKAALWLMDGTVLRELVLGPAHAGAGPRGRAARGLDDGDTVYGRSTDLRRGWKTRAAPRTDRAPQRIAVGRLGTGVIPQTIRFCPATDGRMPQQAENPL